MWTVGCSPRYNELYRHSTLQICSVPDLFYVSGVNTDKTRYFSKGSAVLPPQAYSVFSLTRKVAIFVFLNVIWKEFRPLKSINESNKCALTTYKATIHLKYKQGNIYKYSCNKSFSSSNPGLDCLYCFVNLSHSWFYVYT